MRTLKQKSVIHAKSLSKPCREDNLSESGVYFPSIYSNFQTTNFYEYSSPPQWMHKDAVMESVLNSDDWFSKRMKINRIYIAVFWVVQFGIKILTFRWKVLNPYSGQQRYTLNTEAACSSETFGRLSKLHDVTFHKTALSFKSQWKSQTLRTLHYQQATLCDLYISSDEKVTSGWPLS